MAEKLEAVEVKCQCCGSVFTVLDGSFSDIPYGCICPVCFWEQQETSGNTGQNECGLRLYKLKYKLHKIFKN